MILPALDYAETWVAKLDTHGVVPVLLCLQRKDLEKTNLQEDCVIETEYQFLLTLQFFQAQIDYLLLLLSSIAQVHIPGLCRRSYLE